MIRAIHVNGLQPVIDRSFPLAEIRAAFESYQSQSHFGKVGIDI
jgi:NADPH:quinone reductase-like Zn-dependent oxidoreductase